MTTLHWIILALLLNSLIGLIGVFSLLVRRKKLDKIIFPLVSFTAGVLFGGGFYHLFVESLDELGVVSSVNWFTVGFILFFILEKGLKWHHCHLLKCKVHPFSYMIFLGDAIHNLIDGIVISLTFLVDVNLGIITTLLIIAHEVPQELGNFATAIYGGMEKRKAILFTFLSQLTCIVGGLLGYYLMSDELFLPLLPIAAGGFIYIATSDLVPELHREVNLKKSILSFTLFILGLIFIISLRFFEV